VGKQVRRVIGRLDPPQPGQRLARVRSLNAIRIGRAEEVDIGAVVTLVQRLGQPVVSEARSYLVEQACSALLES
jgi:hypothetical protein